MTTQSQAIPLVDNLRTLLAHSVQRKCDNGIASLTQRLQMVASAGDTWMRVDRPLAEHVVLHFRQQGLNVRRVLLPTVRHARCTYGVAYEFSGWGEEQSTS